MRSRRLLVALATVLVIAPSCSGLARHREGAATLPAPTTREVGRLLKDALPTDAPAPTDAGMQVENGSASFAIQLTDDHGLHPEGIPVKLSGPQNRTLTSDAGGRILGSVPSGRYHVAVVKGCHSAVVVTSGGSADVGLAAGQTTHGDLGVFWKHRYGPSGPVFVSQSGDWPVGTTVDITYAVEDHCTQMRAPGKSYPTFAFRTSSDLKVVEAPVFTANADGRSHVLVSCTEPGAIELDLADRTNPSDHVDLAQLAIGFSGVPRCK